MSTGIWMAAAIAGGTLLVTAGVWAPFLVAARNGRRLLATGIPTRAVVEAVADTGMSVNERPVASFTLAVRGQDGEVYRVRHRQTLPRIPFGVLAPGAVLPVRVDRERPERVRIDWASWRPAPAPSPGGFPAPYPYSPAHGEPL
ncbi:DUF3592 domain-containing protein [Actinomadura sp. ATCC 31491]|uniref:DUF3592 domain-containing protein n=1 Tax=Actinomadura luzonensis TaxID=2805427 RepID=A0ABT0FVW0_9ACTN|nr:DUF3592 domain-containing protein [Actinomadura luzonensis]MCK2216389.1 DUF3592 domain-containing protein [Actinomadura luzonensis]